MIHVQKLGDDPRHQRRVRLVVVGDQLHRAPEQSACGVGVLDPDLHRQESGLAVWGQRAGLTKVKADDEWFGGGRADRQKHKRQQAASQGTLARRILQVHGSHQNVAPVWPQWGCFGCRLCQGEFLISLLRHLIAPRAVRRGAAAIARDNAGLLALDVGVDTGHPGVDVVGQKALAQ